MILELVGLILTGAGAGLFIFRSVGLNEPNLISYSREPTVLNFLFSEDVLSRNISQFITMFGKRQLRKGLDQKVYRRVSDDV